MCLEKEIQNGGGNSASLSVRKVFMEPGLTQGGQLNGSRSLPGPASKAPFSGNV